MNSDFLHLKPFEKYGLLLATVLTKRKGFQLKKESSSGEFQNNRISPYQTLALFGFLVLSLLFSSCKQDDAQVAFEREALSLPSGFTETDPFGNVLNSDNNDWRISPLYASLIFVEPAFPNPTSGENVTIELSISGVNNLTGFNVYFLNQNATPTFLTSISMNPSNFFQVILINPQEFSPTTLISDTIGLHRVIIYDQRNEIITYGDIKVE